jgi:hypothetical protein
MIRELNEKEIEKLAEETRKKYRNLFRRDKK